MSIPDELTKTSLEEIEEDPKETGDWEQEKQETEGDSREDTGQESE